MGMGVTHNFWIICQNPVAVPPLSGVVGAQVIGLEDGGTCQDCLDLLLAKISDIYTILGLPLADASYWPNRNILRALKAEGPARANSFQVSDRFREGIDRDAEKRGTVVSSTEA